jgi:hypothetical protein
MVIAILITMISSNRQILANKKSTYIHIDKMQDQIEAYKQASDEHIQSVEKWERIRRKQAVKSLIKEMNHNMILYEQLTEKVENKSFRAQFNNFITVTMERCLSDSPVDNEIINQNILLVYYVIKVHDNKITSSRIPNLGKSSLENLFKTITEDYKVSKSIFEATLKMLEEYEKNIVP